MANKRKRKVLAVTGIRSEYFFQRPIFQQIITHPDLELKLIVTGSHLSPLHGYTYKMIEADNMPIVDKIESLLYSDRDASRIKGAALSLQILSHIIDSHRPDWLFATGDREEPMLMSLCGAYMNIPVAHYSAGDRVVGNVDDTVRHAISRLSHVLLTTNEDSYRRLLKTGEEEWRLHNVGHSGLDRIRLTPVVTKSELAKSLNIPGIEHPYIVVIQHPISSEIDRAGEQIRETLAAVAALNLQTFVIYPNSDAGGLEIIQVIEEYRSNHRIHIYQTIPDIAFVNLLRNASVLIGNSSMGILEAPYLKLSVINVGNRQKFRHHAENVIFASHERNDIINKVKLTLHDRRTQEKIRKCYNPFGDGYAGERIVKLLAEMPIDANLLNKDLTY